jgi:hypothetical protein
VLGAATRVRTEDQPWGSVTDTGSMEPIPDAVVWAERADAWSQPPAAGPEATGRWQNPSRWPDVAATGRPAFPSAGVGWRSESAEWQASTETARWRTTTEWRSSEGTSGWRSMTEAWQTGGARDIGSTPETPTRQPAISSTPFTTPASDEQPWPARSEPAPPWQSEPTPPWQSADPTPSRTGAPPWQQTPTPAWQQPATPATSWSGTDPTPPPTHAGPGVGQPSWQQEAQASGQQPSGPSGQGSATPVPTWQSATAQAPSWQQPAAQPPTWHTPPTQPPSWQQPASQPPTWQTPAAQPPSWQQPAEPPQQQQSWQQPAQTTPSWQPAETTPSWQQPAQTTASWQQPAEPAQSWQTAEPQPAYPARIEPVYRIGPDPVAQVPTPSWQQAPTPSWQQPAEQPSWQQPAEPRPSWQQPVDATPSWQDPVEETPSWQEPMGPPTGSWHAGSRAPQAIESGPSWQAGTSASGTDRSWDTGSWAAQAGPPANTYPAAWPAYDDGRHLVREDDRAQRRRESTTGMQGYSDDSRRVGHRRAAEPDDGRARGTGWSARSDEDNWAGHTDTGALPLYGDRPLRDDGDWRPGSRSGQLALPEGLGSRSADRVYDEPDSGSWVRDDDRADSRSRRRPSWRDEDDAQDTGTWRRGREILASDPWDRGAADTGVDMEWQSPTDTGSWRMDPRGDTGGWPGDDDRPRRRVVERYEDDDPQEWPGQRPNPAPRGALADTPYRPEPREMPLEIRGQPAGPASWPEQAAIGAAAYREGRTEDWRRELAAEAQLSDGETARFGTSDFPAFRPSGSAPHRPAAAPTSTRPVSDEGGRPREELLVGARSGGSWQGPPETPWPPQGPGYRGSAGVAGPYARRPVGTMPGVSGRQDLLDLPDEDFENETGGPLAAVGYTALWYSIPVVLFVFYMLLLNNAQQAHALDTLVAAIPQFGLSLVLSMGVAVGLRWASGSWKAASVGLAAAVMGGGLATVLMSAITGQSLS